jgi:gluconate 2-dehydrogenase gamma chain
MFRAAAPGIFALAQAACTARDEGMSFEVLSDAEAAAFEAIAARIIPTTDTPGAREAGVIHFMDKAFASFMQEDLDDARRGLNELLSRVDGKPFSGLTESDQDQALTGIEDTTFFALMRTMTVYGFFGMQSYGGNIDNVGWKALGVDEPLHTWQPPFGYYDAQYMQGEQDGE